MSIISIILSIIAVVVSALKYRKVSGIQNSQDQLKNKLKSVQTLQKFARIAVRHSQQLGGTAQQKLSRACSAVQRMDSDDNNSRDFTDAQIRISVQSVIKEQTK